MIMERDFKRIYDHMKSRRRCRRCFICEELGLPTPQECENENYEKYPDDNCPFKQFEKIINKMNTMSERKKLKKDIMLK